MVADNPVDIVVAHVGQCNIVSLQEGQTRIVILKIQGGTHSRRHLIDEAENAVVEDVLDDFPVHAEQFISRFEFQFFGNTARFYCLNNVFRLVFHRSYVLAFPFTSL